MAKQAAAANQHRIWAFGQSWDYQIVTSTIALAAKNFGADSHPKQQIVLHATLSDGSAEGVIGWWNNPASAPAAAHYCVERTNTPQVARPAGGADNSDAGLVDAIRVLDENLRAFHGGNINQASIGIEIVSSGWAWWDAHTSAEPTLDGKHTPISTCPAPTNINPGGAPDWRCNHGRPRDENRFIEPPGGLLGWPAYQAFEDQQYMELILLLRDLCIRHRIPRQFLGRNREEVLRHWDHEGAGAVLRVNQDTLRRFRGILVHRNCHATKPCPGVIDRNRLYRGIIDEWWLPIQIDGATRPYYAGPWLQPAYPAGGPTSNSYFRQQPGGNLVGAVYRNADLDGLFATRSYWDLDQVESYYRHTETRMGGMFPVGVNKVWHGGVHFVPQSSNYGVYAAASGTIVAARVQSNPQTDAHELFGSQRFVLIRHAVYREKEPDPDGVGMRIQYTGDPVFVFSLYMHLAPFRDLAAENDENPPWFNHWRRANAAADVGMDGEKGRVFYPGIQVSVGDLLGFAGNFRNRRMLHFEILTHRDNELTGAPWDDDRLKFSDTDDNTMCNVPALDGFVTDAAGDGIDVLDVLRAAPSLRNSKAMHKSEWALTAIGQIEPLVPNPDRRAVLWPHFQRFSWVTEAIAACPAIKDQLGESSGIFWHYHPVTFMQHIDELVQGENREVQESEDHQVNVETDEAGFLTNFVQWTAAPAAGFTSHAADGAAVHPAYYSPGGDFHFNRREIACNQPGAHDPGFTPPRSTKFSLALLEVVERIRRHFNQPINVMLSYVCNGHADTSLCVMGQPDPLLAHQAGVAVDIRPSAATAASCTALWNSVAAVVDPLSLQYTAFCGSPTEANLPTGYEGIQYHTLNSAEEALRALPQQSIDKADVPDFRIHIELVQQPGLLPLRDPDNTAKLKIVFESIHVLNDQDWFGSGEWNLQATVNYELVNVLAQDANTGDVITLGGDKWTVSVELPANGSLEIYMRGVDKDVICDDSLGEVRLKYTKASSPAWGIGRKSAKSSNGSFAVTFSVQAPGSQDY